MPLSSLHYLHLEKALIPEILKAIDVSMPLSSLHYLHLLARTRTAKTLKKSFHAA